MSAVNRFDSSKKIALIKEVRAATSLGLKEVGCHAMPTVAVLNAAIGALHMLIWMTHCFAVQGVSRRRAEDGHDRSGEGGRRSPRSETYCSWWYRGCGMNALIDLEILHGPAGAHIICS